jgi:hypothetical protein
MIRWIWNKSREETWNLAVAPGTQVSAHEDGLAFLHIPSGRVFVCNRTGARIWQALSSGLNAPAVCDEISRVYHLSQDSARRDTESFLRELERHGLAVRSSR